MAVTADQKKQVIQDYQSRVAACCVWSVVDANCWII